MSTEAKTFLTQLGEMFRKHERNMFEYHKKFFNDYNKLLEDVKGHRSSNKLIRLEEGKDYNQLFFTIHCVSPNTENCIIMTEFGEVTFPPGSFYTGALYPINVLQIKKSGGAEFIGYIS